MDNTKNKVANLSKKNLKCFNKIHLDLKEIEELNLSDNHIEFTDNLLLLSNLKTLNLSFNLLTKLGILPKTLVSLNVASNKLQEIFSFKANSFLSSFDSMVNLKKLDLSRNEIVKLHPSLFANCVSLIYIDLSYNKIFDNIDCFTTLRNLKELNLSHNKIIDIGVLNQLTNCRVQKLNLIGNKVINQQIQQCEQILRKILPKIENLCLVQDRSLTPQPKQTQKVEKSKENCSAISNKSQKGNISPFLKRSSNLSQDQTEKTQRKLSYNFLPSFMEDSKIKQQQVATEQTNQQFFSNTAQTQPSQYTFSGSKQLFSDNSSCTERLEYNPETHKSCNNKLLYMEQKQKMDYLIIQQQAEMLEKFAREREINGNDKQLSFAEIQIQNAQELQKNMNVVYLGAKFDIILLALSKISGIPTSHIDEMVKRLIGTQTFLNSSQKDKISDDLVLKLKE